VKRTVLKVVRIGNSRGVRLPAPLLARYRIKNQVSAEQLPEGILLRPVKDDRLSWEETARAMMQEGGGEFGDLEMATAADALSGLDRGFRNVTESILRHSIRPSGARLQRRDRSSS
jgi:antitoxin MazE